MTPFTVRLLLHWTHALMSIALIVTGLLISYPDLRGSLIGGYGREILEWHLWAGWISMGAPALAMALSARPILRELRRRLGPPDPPYAWRKIHIVATLVLTFLVGASGVVLWLDFDIPLAVVDATLEVHIIVTWILIFGIPLHVVLSWRKTVSRTREMLGIDKVPGAGFPADGEDDDEDDDEFDPLQL